MIAGTFEKVYSNMENGVYNFCVNGKCIECGKCCSAYLPLSKREIELIKSYVEKNNIRPCEHKFYFLAEQPKLDLTCPFLDNTKENHKCTIYKVRPDICRHFKCDTPPSKIKIDKDKFWKTREPYYLWEIFGVKISDILKTI
jgi:Fe-S-cluster containining protein